MLRQGQDVRVDVSHAGFQVQYAVDLRALAREQAGPRRAAHRVLGVGGREHRALLRQAVEGGCLHGLASVPASQRFQVVHGDEQYVGPGVRFAGKERRGRNEGHQESEQVGQLRHIEFLIEI